MNGVNGFLTSGYDPNASGADPDFVIDHVSADSLNYNSSPSLSEKYEILDAGDCVSQNRTYKCNGVYVIETNDQGNGEAYALAGIYERGIFFATLNATGTVINKYRWKLGGAPFNSTQKPPMIAESATSGEYYICGGMAHINGYVMKINASATVLWAKWLDHPVEEAYALMESPYNSNELAVVGRCEFDQSTGSIDAFFALINAGSGNVNSFNRYGFNNGTHADHWFSSIAVANSPTGGRGYVVGGRAVDGASGVSYSHWMIKLDSVGGVVWSTLIEPAGGGQSDEINDVFERYNPDGEIYKYEYYGVSVGQGSAGADDTLIVWRLDDLGSDTWVSPNEFKFVIDPGMGNERFASQIEPVGDGTNQGDGFGAWTTELNANHIFFKNYYNGINGCNDRLKWMQTHQGPGFIAQESPSVTDFGSDCQNFTLQNITDGSDNTCKSWQVAGGGQRVKGAVGINENSFHNNVKVYPVPATDHLIIQTYSKIHETALFDLMGVCVKSAIKLESEQVGTSRFSLRGLKPGTYFLHIMADEGVIVKKILVSGE